jgi:hyperosmotically inducible periplasmic protein
MTSNTCAFLCGAAFGAAMMYFLDPKGGRRRRALVRDKSYSLAHQAEEYAEKKARHYSNVAHGMAHEARKAVGMQG